MPTGLAALRPWFRRVLGGLLSRAQRFDPNTLSWSVLAVGAAAAAVYGVAAHHRWWLLAGPVLVFARMVLATLDGMVAESTGRVTWRGAVVNRVSAEFADMVLLAVLALGRHDRMVPGVLALTTAWGVTFTGLVGLAGEAGPRSDGPAGSTDRLVVLIVASVVGAFVPAHDPIRWFLWYAAVGGLLTVALRLRAVLAEIGQR